MLSSLTILLKKAFSFSEISVSDGMMLLFSTSAMFSFVFTFSEKNYVPKIDIVINVFNAKIAIMGTSNKFYTTITLRCI